MIGSYLSPVRMKETPITRYDQLRHGMRVRCKIFGEQVNDAKISVNADGTIYICQNMRHDSWATDKLGYRCSWRTWNPEVGKTFFEYLSLHDISDLVAVDDIKREAPEPWTPVYERGSDKLTQDLIFTDEFPEGISRDDLNAKTNRYRALVAAHKKHFPAKK